MKNLFPALILSQFCLLALSCRQKDGDDRPWTNIPEPEADWYSAAREVNTVLAIENCFWPSETDDTLYDNTFSQIDSLMQVYVRQKVSTISPVCRRNDVKDYLYGIDEHIFSDEDWLDLDDLKRYHESVELLQRYADAVAGEEGVTTDVPFPYDETQQILHEFMEYMSMLDSEGDGVPNTALLLYYRYLQQVLAYCPDINRITGMVTPDGRAAIYSVGETNYQTYAGPMLLKDSNSRWMPVIHYGKKPNRVYSFTHKGKTFCLFSEHGELKHYSRFSCALFVYEDNAWRSIGIKDYERTLGDWYTKKVLRTEGDVQYVEDWDAHITFNPKELRWNFCYEKDGIFYPHPGSKTLYLDLDMQRSTARLRLASEY